MSRRRSAAEDGFEDLLDGRDPGSSALARVLSAARAPGTRDELSGLADAQAAFLRAHEPQRRHAARSSRLPAATRSAAGRLFALKAAAAVSGVTLVGGVAYAATGAHLLGGGSDQHRVHSPATTPPAGRPVYPAGPAGGTSRYGASHEIPRGGTRPSSHPGGVSSSAHEEHGPSPTDTRTPNPPGPQNSKTPKPTHSPNPHSTETHPNNGNTPTHTHSRAAAQKPASSPAPTPSDQP